MRAIEDHRAAIDRAQPMQQLGQRQHASDPTELDRVTGRIVEREPVALGVELGNSRWDADAGIQRIEPGGAPPV